MEIKDMILYGLATWRLSSLLVNEIGPFHLFVWVREQFNIAHFEDGNVASYPDGFFGDLFSCVWCMSIWVGGAFFAAYLLFPTVSGAFALIFSFSTIAIAIDRLVNHQ